jgi:hypothetical protein
MVSQLHNFNSRVGYPTTLLVMRGPFRHRRCLFPKTGNDDERRQDPGTSNSGCGNNRAPEAQA